MAGNARYTAILDACVLFPPAIADALVSLHVTGLYTARWTSRIDTEWINAAGRNPKTSKEKLELRRDAMRNAIPDWEVTAEAYESLIVGRELPDPDDEHVIAAALAGHADCIVTSNLKHFPDSVLAPLELEAIHPDDFIVYQIDLDPYSALAAFKKMRARLRNPAMSAEAFVSAIERNQLLSTASRLREAIGLIQPEFASRSKATGCINRLMDTLDKDGGLHPLGTWINPRIILFPDDASVRILRHLTPNGKHTGNEVVDIPAAADFR